MTLEKFAQLESATGEVVCNLSDTWWYRVRPFFYRPVLPTITIDPQKVKSSFKKIRSFQHSVDNNHYHNSYLNFIVFDQVQEYDISKISKNCRRKIKRASRNGLTIRPIENLEELTEKGYPLYLIFYNRTKFSYRDDRREKIKFIKWCEELFKFPELSILGAFEGDELVSIDISCLVDDLIVFKEGINSPRGLKLRATDLILHMLRSEASKLENIKCIYVGYVSQNQNINKYKLQRGAKVVSKPAYLHLHPSLLWTLKRVKENVYSRLVGMSEDQIEKWIHSKIE